MAVVGGRTPVATPARAHPLRIGWILEALAVLAVLAVGGATVVVLTRSSSPPAVREAREPTTPLYTAEELAVIRLVARGYVPEETLDGGFYVLKRLVNRGLVPREALGPAPTRVMPLYSAQELALITLVRRGLIPAETLDSATFAIKHLANAGLIPRQTVLPTSAPPPR